MIRKEHCLPADYAGEAARLSMSGVRVALLFALSVLAVSVTIIRPAHAAKVPLIEAAPVEHDASNNSSTDRWTAIREQLFGDRELIADSGMLDMDIPRRAFDGARVPVSVATPRDLGDDRWIRTLYFIVDNNPVPVAATFRFEDGVQWRSVDTELRINEYSFARVVAELSDDSLHISSSFVKAVGGCSAPPSSYDRSDATQLGKFRGGLEDILDGRKPVLARVRLTHPNASGMQFDQFSRTYIPAHFIHTMGASFNGETLFNLDTNFSLSQDPVVGFDFVPEQAGEFVFYAIDSKGQRFEQSWGVDSAATE